MRVRIVVLAAIGLGLLVTEAAAEPAPVKQFRDWLYPHSRSVPQAPAPPPPVQAPIPAEPVPAPPPVAQPIPEPPKAEPAPPPVIVPVPIPVPVAPASKPKPKPKPEAKPAPKAARPSAEQCAQLAQGLNWLGRGGVKQEARKRGYSDSQIEAALKACGY